MYNMKFSRRAFVKHTTVACSVLGFPVIIPARVIGAGAPSKKIQVGIIGCGRIANGMDIPGIWRNKDMASLVALSDCDTRRMAATAEKAKTLFGSDLPQLKLYQNYTALIKDPAVDAVMICSPDFWHAQIAIDAALAGKDVYVQKPLAMTIYESRCIVEIMKKTEKIFHLGTQQRSEGSSTFGPQFRKAAEFVRNGRVGKIKRIEVGLPQDPKEPDSWPLIQMTPATFDYDLWLGQSPVADYCELRTHPQGHDDKVSFGRPGWMTIQNYSMGMISNWGAHHIDIAQWGLGMESSGPIHIEGNADFPKRRLWNVHGKLDVKMKYADGAELHVADVSEYPNGVRFVGEDGWIFCSRGSAKATKNIASAGGRHGRWRPLETSDEKLIEGEVEQKLCRNKDHHRIWFESIHSRKPTNVLPETAHRTTSTCILAYTAMNLKRPLTWNPVTELFVDDKEANSTISRVERAPYGVCNTLKNHGVHIPQNFGCCQI